MPVTTNATLRAGGVWAMRAVRRGGNTLSA